MTDLCIRSNNKYSKSNFTRGRSNSDGAARSAYLEDARAFPSLPNSVLEKMGLHGDTPRDRLSEENLEQKFTTLALAFTIDSATIKDRCERQRRTRDQTETNFNLEVDKLREKLTFLQPFCTDFERAELLSMLFAQVDTLMKAASLVSISAERYGAVQHEERLTESVQLMLTHVQALKQQRDSARRQLQYTKRVLQEPIQPLPIQNQKGLAGINKKIICKRRASVDSVNSLQQDQAIKLNRRISDLSFRAHLPKTTRPSRLDLGMELKKIKEIASDESIKDHAKNVDDVPIVQTILREDSNIEFVAGKNDIVNSPKDTCRSILKHANSFLRCQAERHSATVKTKLIQFFGKWSENDYLRAILNACAVLCFSVSILTLVSLFLEQESVWNFSWFLPRNNVKN
ncbi:lymphoid-restricted membrane protein-like isoform X2 [Sitophilus oryzae]|uniref:Lymphoid-restricted membrane protein-like isoform X2 n=1 Tax=Sitophilus oryzae TaxID=7048 RepID=A0A6J2YVB0_SITOR|nr:lymphoid-restricted membrane protein-like isoform X2 [Sitophilus oryzae]